MARRILITSALPYANGPLHLGHMVEYIQTDIWVRYQRMTGNTCHYIGADDAHGTPIMLRARAEGITPEQLIARFSQEHQADFADFNISFDNYHSTHSDENRHYAEMIYNALDEAGHIHQRTISQLYDPQENIFLPDRFIRGDCPRCGATDQYGDSCEACGATYAPTELKNARSVISGAEPITKDTRHYFFALNHFEAMLKQWTAAGHLQPEISNKLAEWFEAGLHDWDISRDAPYFGFRIPGTDDKYFYVWLDAPIGYMASFKNYCDKSGTSFDEYWAPDSTAELYHFIGKDIIYFHALFWPAMLHGAGFRTPDAVLAHGFLTVDGQKMSKSRGTFIKARTYLNHLDPEYLRYYFAARMGPGIDDLDLNLHDFRERVNSDLVGKVVNIASRCAGFIHRQSAGRLSAIHHEQPLYDEFIQATEQIAAHYEARDYAKAMRHIMALADRANQYIADKQPWVHAGQPDQQQQVQDICSTGLNLFRVLITCLKPVLPQLAEKSETFLNGDVLQWHDIKQPLPEGHTIKPFRPLMTRMEKNHIEAMIADSKTDPDTEITPPADAAGYEPVAQQIQIDDFARIDLRVARIIKAEHIEGADKLLRLTLDIGTETRNIMAGIKTAYNPAELEGRLTVMVANLAPRKMRFGTSQGMLLAAGPGGKDPNVKDLFILQPDQGAQPGMRIT